MPPPADSRVGPADGSLSRRPASSPSLSSSDRKRPIRRADSLPQGIAGYGAKPSKLLFKVTVQRNLWPVHVMISPDSTVVELIKATVEAYAKEGRRPSLQERNSQVFELHFSQFSMESLSREEKVMNLGSRSFFLSHNPREGADESEKGSSRFLFPLSRFIGLALGM